MHNNVYIQFKVLLGASMGLFDTKRMKINIKDQLKHCIEEMIQIFIRVKVSIMMMNLFILNFIIHTCENFL